MFKNKLCFLVGACLVATQPMAVGDTAVPIIHTPPSEPLNMGIMRLGTALIGQTPLSTIISDGRSQHDMTTSLSPAQRYVLRGIEYQLIRNFPYNK